MVVDGELWVDTLPTIISAVVMVDTESDTSTSRQAWTFTRKAHTAFLDAYGLSATNVPLVQYDVAATPPFRLLA